MIRALALACLAGLTTGCATQTSLYHWGSYEDDLLSYYHTPATQDAVIARHLDLLAQLEASAIRPAPGLLAEAGTLLLLKGDNQGARSFYQKEYDAWPESRTLMGALIQNLTEGQP